MKYQSEGPGRPKNTAIEVVVAELERLRQRDGGVRPKTLVDESRPDEAPLHQEFEWEDAAAAEKYREEQARRIIRSVVLVPDPEKDETTPMIRAYTSLHDPSVGTIQARIYQPTLDVLRSKPDAAAVKARMLRELMAMRQRYLDFLKADQTVNALVQEMAEALAT